MTEEHADILRHAFTEFIDLTIDQLIEQGVPEDDALEFVFHTATALAEADILPEFPEDDENHPEQLGEWLLQAVELDFLKFCTEAALGKD